VSVTTVHKLKLAATINVLATNLAKICKFITLNLKYANVLDMEFLKKVKMDKIFANVLKELVINGIVKLNSMVVIIVMKLNKDRPGARITMIAYALKQRPIIMIIKVIIMFNNVKLAQNLN